MTEHLRSGEKRSWELEFILKTPAFLSPPASTTTTLVKVTCRRDTEEGLRESSQRSSECPVAFAYPGYLASYKNITPSLMKGVGGLPRGADHSKADNALRAVTLTHIGPILFSCISLIFLVGEREKSFSK